MVTAMEQFFSTNHLTSLRRYKFADHTVVTLGFNDRCRTQCTGAVDGGGTVEPLLNDFPESGYFTKPQFLVGSTAPCNKTPC